MKILEERLEDKYLFLSIEADPALVRDSYEKHFLKVCKKITIPGFRKGFAPKDMVMQYLINRKQIDIEHQKICHDVSKAVIKHVTEDDNSFEEKIFGSPIEVKINSLDFSKNSIIFEFKFEKFPVVTVANYSRIPTLIEHKEVQDKVCFVGVDKEADVRDVVAVSMIAKSKDDQIVFKYTYDMLEIDLEVTKIRKEIIDAILGSKAKDKKTLTIEDNGLEISLEILIVEVREKREVNEDLLKHLNISPDVSLEKFKQELTQQYIKHNSFVRYQDILKFLFSKDHTIEPFPLETLRIEVSKAYREILKRGNPQISFEGLFYEYVKNLRTTLVLNAISKKENIKFTEQDKADFLKDVDEQPWLYGNKKSDDIFNLEEKVLSEYVVQFKTLRFLSDRWVFSS